MRVVALHTSVSLRGPFAETKQCVVSWLLTAAHTHTIPHAHAHIPLLYIQWRSPRFIDILGRQLCQLRHKAPDVLPLRVVLLPKGHWAVDTVVLCKKGTGRQPQPVGSIDIVILVIGERGTNMLGFRVLILGIRVYTSIS